MTSFWGRVVDEMVRLSSNDPELKDALLAIKQKAEYQGQSFYKAVWDVIYRDRKSYFKN